jgi:hypothetical protein
MKNLTKLGFLLSVGSIAAFSVGGCSSDGTPTTPTAGTSAGGSSAGTGTSGTATGGSSAGTGTSGTATGGGGASAGTGTGGKAGGGGTGGAAGGTGGASGGTGGASGGGGKAGGGGTGGGGGGGGKAGGGGTGGGGGAPSADCTKWCSGAMGVVQFCAGSGLAANVNTEQKCIAHCTAPEAAGAMGLACWNTHLTNAITNMADATMKMLHCTHASGAAGQTVCNKTM